MRCHQEIAWSLRIVGDPCLIGLPYGEISPKGNPWGLSQSAYLPQFFQSATVPCIIPHNARRRVAISRDCVPVTGRQPFITSRGVGFVSFRTRGTRHFVVLHDVYLVRRRRLITWYVFLLFRIYGTDWPFSVLICDLCCSRHGLFTGAMGWSQKTCC